MISVMLSSSFTAGVMSPTSDRPSLPTPDCGFFPAAARDGALSIRVGTLLPLERTALAHDRVDHGTYGRVLLAIPD